ncbi:unnamed protein product [Ambrosiozyma monospora]|uniref:Unnamed protein product n=1 Tax=Ambrosiozyma monospora TaxID=43982 RepID=A0ACB5SUS4_AMBMO|nr:unnamed protein product [Ambrosiozyma monospora]
MDDVYNQQEDHQDDYPQKEQVEVHTPAPEEVEEKPKAKKQPSPKQQDSYPTPVPTPEPLVVKPTTTKPVTKAPKTVKKTVKKTAATTTTTTTVTKKSRSASPVSIDAETAQKSKDLVSHIHFQCTDCGVDLKTQKDVKFHSLNFDHSRIEGPNIGLVFCSKCQCGNVQVMNVLAINGQKFIIYCDDCLDRAKTTNEFGQDDGCSLSIVSFNDGEQFMFRLRQVFYMKGLFCSHCGSAWKLGACFDDEDGPLLCGRCCNSGVGDEDKSVVDAVPDSDPLFLGTVLKDPSLFADTQVDGVDVEQVLEEVEVEEAVEELHDVKSNEEQPHIEKEQKQKPVSGTIDDDVDVSVEYQTYDAYRANKKAKELFYKRHKPMTASRPSTSGTLVDESFTSEIKADYSHIDFENWSPEEIKAAKKKAKRKAQMKRKKARKLAGDTTFETTFEKESTPDSRPSSAGTLVDHSTVDLSTIDISAIKPDFSEIDYDNMTPDEIEAAEKKARKLASKKKSRAKKLLEKAGLLPPKSNGVDKKKFDQAGTEQTPTPDEEPAQAPAPAKESETQPVVLEKAPAPKPVAPAKKLTVKKTPSKEADTVLQKIKLSCPECPHSHLNSVCNIKSHISEKPTHTRIEKAFNSRPVFCERCHDDDIQNMNILQVGGTMLMCFCTECLSTKEYVKDAITSYPSKSKDGEKLFLRRLRQFLYFKDLECCICASNWMLGYCVDGVYCSKCVNKVKAGNKVVVDTDDAFLKSVFKDSSLSADDEEAVDKETEVAEEAAGAIEDVPYFGVVDQVQVDEQEEEQQQQAKEEQEVVEEEEQQTQGYSEVKAPTPAPVEKPTAATPKETNRSKQKKPVQSKPKKSAPQDSAKAEAFVKHISFSCTDCDHPIHSFSELQSHISSKSHLRLEGPNVTSIQCDRCRTNDITKLQTVQVGGTMLEVYCTDCAAQDEDDSFGGAAVVKFDEKDLFLRRLRQYLQLKNLSCTKCGSDWMLGWCEGDVYCSKCCSKVPKLKGKDIVDDCDLTFLAKFFKDDTLLVSEVDGDAHEEDVEEEPYEEPVQEIEEEEEQVAEEPVQDEETYEQEPQEEQVYDEPQAEVEAEKELEVAVPEPVKPAPSKSKSTKVKSKPLSSADIASANKLVNHIKFGCTECEDNVNDAKALKAHISSNPTHTRIEGPAFMFISCERCQNTDISKLHTVQVGGTEIMLYCTDCLQLDAYEDTPTVVVSFEKETELFMRRLRQFVYVKDISCNKCHGDWMLSWCVDGVYCSKCCSKLPKLKGQPVIEDTDDLYLSKVLNDLSLVIWAEQGADDEQGFEESAGEKLDWCEEVSEVDY